jgi:hypothetical protein
VCDLFGTVGFGKQLHHRADVWSHVTHVVFENVIVRSVLVCQSRRLSVPSLSQIHLLVRNHGCYTHKCRAACGRVFSNQVWCFVRYVFDVHPCHPTVRVFERVGIRNVALPKKHDGLIIYVSSPLPRLSTDFSPYQGRSTLLELPSPTGNEQLVKTFCSEHTDVFLYNFLIFSPPFSNDVWQTNESRTRIWVDSSFQHTHTHRS